MTVYLIGACGRMGRETAAYLMEQGAHVVGVDVSPAPMPFPVYTAARKAEERADAIIDFSSPAALGDTIDFAEKNAVPLVLAATGYTEEDDKKIDLCAKKVPVLRTGNLSIGINVLQFLVKKAAAALEGFDAEIIERHHNKKKDAPSGTALMLAESVRAGAGAREAVYGRQGAVGARKKTELGIHAVRGGTIVGEHEVMFAGEDEILTLSHSARSRRVFAVGAYRAALWLIGKPAGLYSMDDMLGNIL